MSSKCKTKCDAAKVCNEATGRCVLRTGKIGQQILGTAAPKPKPAAAAAPKPARGQCPPCDAAKVCNVATGKCVLRTGKIGQQILGTAAPKPKPAAAAAPKPVAAPKPRPLTIEEVRRNWPKGIAKLVASKKLDKEDDLWESHPWWYRGGLPKFFGPGAEYLTYKRIQELVPKPGDTARIVVTYENNSAYAEHQLTLDPANAWYVTLHRPASAAELWKYRATESDSAHEIFDVDSKKVVVNGEIRFLPDYTTAQMPTEELARRVVIATFSGRTKFMNYLNNATSFPPTIFEIFPGDTKYNADVFEDDSDDADLGLHWSVDSRFITWIAPSTSRAANVTVNWSRPGVPMAMNAAIVNASNRGGQKVAASRKAPAGHAKNFANQTARGIDGKVWRSSQVKVKDSTGKYRTTYRWVPVK